MKTLTEAPAVAGLAASHLLYVSAMLPHLNLPERMTTARHCGCNQQTTRDFGNTDRAAGAVYARDCL
jgi:hypothetical protein